VASSCEYGDEPSGSGATELISVLRKEVISSFETTVIFIASRPCDTQKADMALNGDSRETP
jgi:hypothetical protein